MLFGNGFMNHGFLNKYITDTFYSRFVSQTPIPPVPPSAKKWVLQDASYVAKPGDIIGWHEDLPDANWKDENVWVENTP